MKKYFFITSIVLLTLMFTSSSYSIDECVEYSGCCLAGFTYDGKAYSHVTKKTYDIQVDFNVIRGVASVIIFEPNLMLVLDEGKIIKDPHNIKAHVDICAHYGCMPSYDPLLKDGSRWDLDVEINAGFDIKTKEPKIIRNK